QQAVRRVNLTRLGEASVDLVEEERRVDLLPAAAPALEVRAGAARAAQVAPGAAGQLAGRRKRAAGSARVAGAASCLHRCPSLSHMSIARHRGRFRGGEASQTPSAATARRSSGRAGAAAPAVSSATLLYP